MVFLSSFHATSPTDPWLQLNPAVPNCRGEQQTPGLQFLGLQFSCPALRFSCLPRGEGVCEIKPAAAKAGKAMKTPIGMLWEYSLFNYCNQKMIQKHRGDRKPEEIRNKNCCFPLKPWGQEQTHAQMQVSSDKQGPTLRD